MKYINLKSPKMSRRFAQLQEEYLDDYEVESIDDPEQKGHIQEFPSSSMRKNNSFLLYSGSKSPMNLMVGDVQLESDDDHLRKRNQIDDEILPTSTATSSPKLHTLMENGLNDEKYFSKSPKMRKNGSFSIDSPTTNRINNQRRIELSKSIDSMSERNKFRKLENEVFNSFAFQSNFEI